MADEAKVCSPICPTYKALVMWPVWSDRSGTVMEKSWIFSFDQCQMQALQFSVYLINLLSILLRCNGFARIQKAVVDHTSSRPLNGDHDLFWCKFGFGKCFGASSWSNHWAGYHWLLYKVHLSSCITICSRNGSLLLHRIREDDISKQWFFFYFQSAHEAPTYQAFSSFQFASNAEWPWNGQHWVLQ